MATRRDELVAAATRLFAERGYHGTSMADLAEAMGVQKGSLYSLTESKQELLVAVTREGAAFRAERRRYEERWRDLCREAAERGALRADLDVEAAVLLVLSAANWAYTWIRPGADTRALADRFFAIFVDGVRGYATPPV